MVPTAEGLGQGGAGQPWRHSRAPHEATSARRHGAHKRDCRELSKPPAQEHAGGTFTHRHRAVRAASPDEAPGAQPEGCWAARVDPRAPNGRRRDCTCRDS